MQFVCTQYRPWLSRQTGPISSAVTRNAGPLHKYQSRALPPYLSASGPLTCSTPSFPLLLFVTLSLAPLSPLPSYPSPVNGESRLTNFKI